MKNISVTDLKEKINTVTIIDIRNNSKYQQGHIPGAINIEKTKLLSNPEQYLKSYDTYYLYCEYGSNSLDVCYKLNALGYNAININGGYSVWKLVK